MKAPGTEPLISKTKLRKMIEAGWEKTSDDRNDSRYMLLLLRHGQNDSILITRLGIFEISNGDIVEIDALPVTTAARRY